MIIRILTALILSVPVAGQNLIAHYKLDETSGTVAADSSGNGIDGMTVATTSWVPGQIGGGIDLSGFGHVRAPSSPLHDVSFLTIAAWVNVDFFENWDGILTKGVTATPYTLQLGIPGGRFKFTANANGPIGGSGTVEFTSLGTMTLTRWHHLAVTFDGNEVRLYMDGQLDSVHAAPGTVLGTIPEELVLGADLPGGQEYFDGRLDDVRLYDGALTAADIAALASAPIGANYCGSAIPNSTGFAATIAATGSTTASLNNLTLTADQLPTGQFGYFLAGQTQGFFNPPGSQGFICLSGNIGRYNAVPEIIQGPTGSLQIDLTSIPVNPPQAVLPGDTWNFQCWFRDNNPGLTSNFTDGVSVTFL